MEELTQKQLLARLEEVLNGLGVPGNGPSQVVNPVTKQISIQNRNPRKAMIKMFKEFDYNRQIHELIALEARYQQEEHERTVAAAKANDDLSNPVRPLSEANDDEGNAASEPNSEEV